MVNSDATNSAIAFNDIMQESFVTYSKSNVLYKGLFKGQKAHCKLEMYFKWLFGACTKESAKFRPQNESSVLCNRIAPN